MLMQHCGTVFECVKKQNYKELLKYAFHYWQHSKAHKDRKNNQASKTEIREGGTVMTALLLLTNKGFSGICGFVKFICERMEERSHPLHMHIY